MNTMTSRKLLLTGSDTHMLLFEAGVTAKIISDRLGHNNVQTTLDMYTHINDNQRFEVVEQLMDFIRSS